MTVICFTVFIIQASLRRAQTSDSKVLPPREDLLAGGAEDERVFKLSHVRASHIAERRAGIDDADIAEVL
jgi:hypothetical protein